MEEEIGRRLRAAREAQGISIDQAEEETKIRRKYLEALENAREADIPGEVYLKGFLRTYGNYVGLDGTELVEAYKLTKHKRQRQQEGTARGEAEGQRTAAGGGGTAAPVKSPPTETVVTLPRPVRERTAEGPFPERRPRERPAVGSGIPGATRSLGVAVVALLLVGAVGYLGWLILRQVGAGPKPQPKPPEPPPAATTTPTTPPPKLPDPPKVSMTRGTGEDVIFTVPAKEIQVKLEFGADRVWMKAEVDGKVAYEGFPTAPLEFKGAGMKLRMGNMDGVSVTVNGQRFEKPLDNQTYNLIFKSQ